MRIMCSLQRYIYANAFQYRINGGSPQTMNYKKKEEEKYECKGATEDKSIPSWYQVRIPNVRCVDSLDIYTSRSIPAYLTWQVELKVVGFKPIILGTIDCTQKSMQPPVPSFLKQCQKGKHAVLKVHAVEPPLVYTTAGLEFERFVDAVQDQWRVSIMNFVKQGVRDSHLDANQKINTMQFQKAIGCLHEQCQSKQLGIQFGTALKALKQ